MVAKIKRVTGLALDKLSTPGMLWTTFLFVFALLLLEMAPVFWKQNEIHYFDLAWRFVAPERFSPNSAVFDSSASRMLSFGLVGLLIETVGIDAALVITRIVIAAGFALTISTLASSWSLSTGEVVVAILAFVFLDQNYFAGEWIFGGVGPKSFAYIVVFAGIAFASRGLGRAAILSVALATYFHFLVGGFWAASVILLMALQEVPLKRVARLSMLYFGVILPIVVILIYERIILSGPDVSDFHLTLNQIYAVVRNQHHVAPFESLQQFMKWLPGISEMLAATFLSFTLLFSDRRISRPLIPWICILHVYLVVAFIVAFLDRNTHAFAPFYLFRPNALILLLSLFVFTHWLRLSLSEYGGRSIAALAISAAIIYVGPNFVNVSHDVVRFSSSIPVLARFHNENISALIDWLKSETDPNAVIVLESTQNMRWNASWIAFERLVQRPSLVCFKFVPTSKNDLARWYRLIQWREAVFRGDCERLQEQPVDYLVTVQPTTRDLLAQCGKVLWERGEYGIIGNLRKERLTQ